MNDRRARPAPGRMFAWVFGTLATVGVVSHVITGTPWWATLLWVVVFLVPGVILMLRTLNLRSAGGAILGPIIFAVILISWVFLGQQ